MKTIEKRYMVPFLLVSSLFLLWGLANSMTDTLIAAFKNVMQMSDIQSSLIVFAFFGSYFCFALPAALFIRKYSYKAGVLLGLSLYATGAIMFYPAAHIATYGFYLLSIYVLAAGCSILETTANPYILSMGSPETATRRLNIAQSLNPVGSISGILLSQTFILSNISLDAISGTYMVLGFVLMAILIVMAFVKMPLGNDGSSDGFLRSTRESFGRLLHNKRYVFGVVTQFFYVGAQTGVWSYIIRIMMKEFGIVEHEAADFYLASIICFCVARWFFTWLMGYFKPAKLMAVAAMCCILLSAIVVWGAGTGWVRATALVLISFFMSLQFPTIYGIALEGIGDDAKIGASGLIMAILGGAIITPLQGKVSDMFDINTAYLVPLVCFVIVFAYSLYGCRKTSKIG